MPSPGGSEADVAHVALSRAIDGRETAGEGGLYSPLAVGGDGGTDYALWIVRPALVAHMDDKWRFFSNIDRVTSLTLPGLARAIDAGVYRGVDYVLFERCPATLSDWLQGEEQARAAQLVWLVRCLAHSLDVLRGAELVHGYLSAADIGLVAEDPLLYGAGYWSGLDPVLLREAAAGGALAPEVLRGDIPGPAADLFSVALLIARSLLGGAALEAAQARARLGDALPQATGLRAALDPRPAARPSDLWGVVGEVLEWADGDPAPGLDVSAPASETTAPETIEIWADEPYDPDTAPTAPVDMRPYIEASRRPQEA